MDLKTPETRQKEYLSKINKIGTITMLVILALTYLPSLYVFFILGEFPGWGAVAAVIPAQGGQMIATWILEPLMLLPMLGVAGTYICCTAGNSLNMRLPCATAAKNTVNAPHGTPRADCASVFGMVASVVVNLVVLLVVVVFGNFLLSVLPEDVKEAFNYAMPAIYGCMLTLLPKLFFSKKKK